jgi:hypothetical protein
MADREDDTGTPCSRTPAELCDGAKITWDNGERRRVPALTSRAFCEPCRSRIITCLGELPSAYARLAAALGDTPRTGSQIRVPFGPSEPIRGEIDALMRVTAVILAGWDARVRGSRLRLSRGDPRRDIHTAGYVRDAAQTLGKHVDVLLALQPGWMTRVFTFPFAKPGKTFAAGTAGQAPIPDEIEREIGHEEIVRVGDGWVKVTTRLGGPAAGNEILDLHYRARRRLGETRPQPESFDGIPCRACDEMSLERAEPPSDPKLAAKKSRCALCKDEMDDAEFAQWCEMYASWAHGAQIQVCKRCTAGRCGECCWHACSCAQVSHPRRPAAA